MSGAFERAVQIVVGHEGGYDTTASDPGNWTSGITGVGALRGTKFGISAAAYAHLDIAALSLDDARAIYRRDYWNLVRGEDLPPRLALLVFDAAVNNGVTAASRWLQATVGAQADGVIGAATLRAVAQTIDADGETALCCHFQAKRVFFMGCLPTWRVFGHGWAERLCMLPYQSLTMES